MPHGGAGRRDLAPGAASSLRWDEHPERDVEQDLRPREEERQEEQQPDLPRPQAEAPRQARAHAGDAAAAAGTHEPRRGRHASESTRAGQEQRDLPEIGLCWILGSVDMDETPKTEEFVVGDSFARVLTETTQSLVCVYDREGRILLFNEACEGATGLTRAEVLGRNARDVVIPPEERQAFEEFLDYVWSANTSSPQVGHWQTKGGGRRLIAWSNKPMLDGNGR